MPHTPSLPPSLPPSLSPLAALLGVWLLFTLSPSICSACRVAIRTSKRERHIRVRPTDTSMHPAMHLLLSLPRHCDMPMAFCSHLETVSSPPGSVTTRPQHRYRPKPPADLLRTRSEASKGAAMRHCWHASASPARPGMLEGEQKPQSPRSTPSNLLQTPAASAATKTRAQQRQPEAAELRRRAFGPRHVAYLAYLPAGSLLPGHNGKQARPVKSMHPFTALRSALPTLGQAFHKL